MASLAHMLLVGVWVHFMGCSTPMNTSAAFIFRLNQPVVQAFNWVLGPLKIALIFPFLRFGEWIFQAEPFTLSLTEFSERFFSDWQATSSEFAWTFVHAIVGWMVWAPLVWGLLYLAAKPLVVKLRPEKVAGDR